MAMTLAIVVELCWSSEMYVHFHEGLSVHYQYGCVIEKI